MKYLPQLKFVLVLVVLGGSWFAFSGCGIDEQHDLKSQDCTSDCFNIQGRFTTSGTEDPIAGVEVKIQWEDLGIHGGVVRSKAQAQTNDTGDIEIHFTQREDEVNRGTYKVLYTANEKFFFVKRNDNVVYIDIFKKDSLYAFDFQIPRLAYAAVTVTNPNDIETGDSFYIQFLTPYGLNGEELLYSGTSAGEATPGKRIFIGADVPVTVRLSKTKDGVSTTEDQVISAAPGQTKTLAVTF